MASPGSSPLPVPRPPALALRRLPPPPDPRRRWIWIIGPVCLLLPVLAWWLLRPAPQAREAGVAPIRTARARVGPLLQTMRLTGTTRADRFALMLAPTMRGTRNGRSASEFMLELEELVTPGSFVKKGQVVARFDRQYMLSRLDDFRSWVIQHENSVKRLRALLAVTRARYDQQVAKARATMEKAALDLKKIPILSEIQAETARLAHEEAVARYKEVAREVEWVMISEGAAIQASELDLRQSRMEFDRARRHADRMEVRAPLDGITVMLTTRRGQEHAQIQQGDQVAANQPYMRIVDKDSMVVQANLNQVDGQAVRVGMPAKVHFDAFPELELPARVTAVGALAQGTGWRAAWVRNVAVNLKLEQLDPRVIPDLSVSADLVLDSVDNAVVVPRECVFTAGDDSYAWVQGESGWEKRPLETGVSSSVEVAVRTGLQGGETLAAEAPAK